MRWAKGRAHGCIRKVALHCNDSASAVAVAEAWAEALEHCEGREKIQSKCRGGVVGHRTGEAWWTFRMFRLKFYIRVTRPQLGPFFCPEIRAFTGFGTRFLQPFPKSLVTVKHHSNTKMAVNSC